MPRPSLNWNPSLADETEQIEAFDVNGNVLSDGDSVVVIKDLPVKGAPKPVKAGTKVKNIRLVEGDHNISCKIDGFGAMGLKSEFEKSISPFIVIFGISPADVLLRFKIV